MSIVLPWNRDRVVAAIPAGCGEVTIIEDDDRTRLFEQVESVIRGLKRPRTPSEAEALRGLKNALNRFDATALRFKSH
jgi:hypothetical protein